MNPASDIQSSGSSSIGVLAVHAALSAGSTVQSAAMSPDVSALLQHVAAATQAAAVSVAKIAARVTPLEQAQQGQGQHHNKGQTHMPTGTQPAGAPRGGPARSLAPRGFRRLITPQVCRPNPASSGQRRD